MSVTMANCVNDALREWNATASDAGDQFVELLQVLLHPLPMLAEDQKPSAKAALLAVCSVLTTTKYANEQGVNEERKVKVARAFLSLYREMVPAAHDALFELRANPEVAQPVKDLLSLIFGKVNSVRFF